MATSTQTVVEEDWPKEISVPPGGPVTVEESADRLERDGQRSSWPDVFNKAREINLNIGGLQVNVRINFVILLVLVLCFVIWAVARWSTLSSPTGSQPSDVPTLRLIARQGLRGRRIQESLHPCFARQKGQYSGQWL